VEDVIYLMKLEGIFLKLDSEENLQIHPTNGEEIREEIQAIIMDWAEDLRVYLLQKEYLDS
jgi:hypothetical protein